MKRMTYFVMALALVLGFTQCKKEQTPANNETEGVFITLDVNGGNNGSRVIVDPNAPQGYATVTFEDGDVIYVGNAGVYCGYLTFNGTNFTGTVNPTSTADYLHFYFMGNKGPADSAPTEAVSITDQTVKYPVISYAHSTDLYSSTQQSYTAKLKNYCSIVKFTTNAIDTETAITVKGMQNTVSVDFGANNAATSTLDNNPYTPGNSGTGDITLHAVSPTERWAILLEQDAVNGATVTASGYSNSTCNVPGIANNTYHPNGVQVSLTPAVWDGDLSKLTNESTEAFATAADGMTITGTLGANVKVSIADGATVTLDNVTINGEMDIAYRWAGISCLGDATIILKDGTTNTVKGFFHIYPGIHIATGHTLTIQGTGSLDASSNGNGAGIGGGAASLSCGNISIESGIITATGGGDCAGIGGGAGNGMTEASCGYITISGGTVTAVNNGGSFGAGPGIGSGRRGSCGNITITDGASVTATKGNYALDCIGRGQDGTCGTVTIGGTVYPSGATPNQGDGLTFVYPVPAPPTAPAGAINGLFSVSATQQVWFSQGNLLKNNGDFADDQYIYGGLLQWAASFTSNYSGDWRALTSEEWNYLFTNRTNASNLWGFANVQDSNEIQFFNGIILLPDGSSLSINTNHSAWDNNSIDNTTWLEMEANGAVFLPAAGYSDGGSPEDTTKKGYYWCSMSGGYVRFGGSGSSFEAPTCYVGGGGRRSVRLVINVQ